MFNAQLEAELRKLLAKLCDDHLNSSEQARLAEILTDEEAQHFYLRWMELHAELIIEGQGITLEPAERLSSPKGQIVSRSHWSFSRTLLVLAATVLVAFLGWSMVNRNSIANPGVAAIVSQEDLIWESGEPARHDAIEPGPMNLLSGKAELQMQSGARLMIEGPAQLSILDSKAVKLISGRISLDVPDSAIGFRVVTRSADVVDLGTTFSVSVDNVGDTQVHVDEGVVVARSLQNDGVVPLLTREAANFDHRTGDFASIDFKAGGYANSHTGTETATAYVSESEPFPGGARVVFLGDHLTDKETHLLLIAQAVEELPEGDRPRIFNAGLSLPLAFEESEFQAQVALLKPTHAVLEFGSEISTYQGVISPAEFTDRILRLCDRLEEEHISPILETTILANEVSSEWQDRLFAYNNSLRQIARQRNYRLVDFERYRNSRMSSTEDWLASNGIALTVSGYRELAGVLLADFFKQPLTVPETIENNLIPGTLTSWKYKFQAASTFLSDAEVDEIQIDDTWRELSLPQPPDKIVERATGSSYLVTPRDRKRGFATGLWGKDRARLIAVTNFMSDAPRQAYLNTGATLRGVWINGERVYGRFEQKEWTGWHAGKERIPIQLRAGDNQIVIEADNSFFVGITDSPDWSVQ